MLIQESLKCVPLDLGKRLPVEALVLWSTCMRLAYICELSAGGNGTPASSPTPSSEHAVFYTA